MKKLLAILFLMTGTCYAGSQGNSALQLGGSSSSSSSSGDITDVIAGTGLSGGASSGAATLNVVSTAAYQTSINTFTSSQTYNGTMVISSGLVTSGSAGSSGQVLTSGGAGTIPTWAATSVALPFPAGATNYANIDGTSIQNGAVWVSSATFGTVSISSTVVFSTSAVTAALATRGWISMPQETGVIPQGIIFYNAVGTKVADIRKQFNGNLSLVNEEAATSVDIGTGGTVRFSILSGAQARFTGGIIGNGTYALFNSSVNIVTNNTNKYGLTVSTTNTGPYTIAVSTINHVNYQEFPSSPTVSACGTAPAIIGNDTVMEITPGGSASGCVVTFSQAYTKKPICSVTPQTESVVNAFSYTVSATAVTMTQTSMSSIVDIYCVGRD